MSALLFSADGKMQFCNTNTPPSKSFATAVWVVTRAGTADPENSERGGRKKFRRDRILNHTKDGWLQLKNLREKRGAALSPPPPPPLPLLYRPMITHFPYCCK